MTQKTEDKAREALTDLEETKEKYTGDDISYALNILTELGEKYNLNTKRIVKRIHKLRDNNEKEDSLFLALNESLNEIAMDAPDWTFVAAKFLTEKLYREAASNREYNANKKYGDFHKLIHILTEKGIYSKSLLENYSKAEIKKLEKVIDPNKDNVFNFIGLFMLSDRYLAKDHDKNLYELPQERFMVIAMKLMQEEPKNKRIEFVKEAYWALSNLYMTVATPTLANAGKSYGQLSSCFIDTVSDSLDGIYDGNWSTARVSKGGGGVGVYMGKVRARGSAIKGFKGNSSGVIPWIRLLNNTAVSVDQLGQRKGAIAIYLDVWHKDIAGFLDLRTNNGDERQKAHDIFPAITIPDLFMQKLKEVDENGRSIGEWNAFCPHEVKQFMGWKDKDGNPLGLEDFYDEDNIKYFTEKYYEAVNNPLLPRKKYRAMDIMSRIMKSQLETGMPYMFYRDEVNRQNANKHVLGEGRTSIYSSNLCTEITQNQSATEITKEYVNEDGDIVIIKKPGDYVVCNLSSINLPRAVAADEEKNGVLERLINIQVRMLDNVIDLNTIPVLQAQITNKKYRAVGLGTFGWHHLLANKRIHWESEEAVEYADNLYEIIAYLTINASKELAKERGTYSLFEGSQWHTGEYFEKRDYIDNGTEVMVSGEYRDWNYLMEQVKEHGVRNGYLMAVAPNSTTAKIGGSTDGIDPIYNVEYAEEKKNFKFKVTAPDLDHNSYPFYSKPRYEYDQLASIKQNAKRQRHVDQAISFNLYIKHDIKATDLLNIHMTAWEERLKTTYYVRSTSQEEMDICEACHS